MSRKITHAKDAVPIGQVYGDTWKEIKNEARRVAGIPFGKVTFDPNYCVSPGMQRTFHCEGEGQPRKKDYYAWVVVTPPHLADDGRYSLDELKKAARETTSLGSETFDNLARQIRKNRVFDAHK